jgi:membrane protein
MFRFNKNAQLKVLIKNYYLFIRDFFTDLFDDNLGHFASSLSWSTVFSIVPLLVIFLSFFTKMALFESLYERVQKIMFENLVPTDSQIITDYINTFIQNSDKLGYIGAFYVTFAAIMFFKNYDYIVNYIFDAPLRGVVQAVKTYLLLLLIIPAMMAVSFYLSIFIQGYLDKTEITSFIHLYSFLPYLMAWMMFYIAYQISPNIHIDVQSALISSFIASLIWYLSKSAFVFYVMHNKTYASIYGSISTILFFFLWIYISWAIFIHGLKFCALLNKDEDIEHI